MIANRLWVDAAGDPLAGAVTLAPVNPLDRLAVTENADGFVLHGTANDVPWGSQASTVLAFARDANGKGFLCRARSDHARPNRIRRNVAYEPRVEMLFDGVHLLV